MCLGADITSVRLIPVNKHTIDLKPVAMLFVYVAPLSQLNLKVQDQSFCTDTVFVPLIVNRGKWFGRLVNIKETNKQAKIYVGRPLTLHTFCFMLIDYAPIT